MFNLANLGRTGSETNASNGKKGIPIYHENYNVTRGSCSHASYRDLLNWSLIWGHGFRKVTDNFLLLFFFFSLFIIDSF